MPYSDPKANAGATKPKASGSAISKGSQKYPSTLSKQGGPSRKPSRKAYPAPSIDDILPSPPALPAAVSAPSAAAVIAAAIAPTTGRTPHPLPPKPGKWSSTIPLRPSGNPPAGKVLGNSTRANILPRSTTPSGTSTPRKASGAGPKAEYSSLQHLLEQAGYKETRVWTPPAEKLPTRKVKKTFDEVDPAEVDALYSVFGIPRNQGVSHTTITEPSLPLKSSSSILHSIAIRERAASPPAHGESNAGSPRSVESWWGGGFAALGRAAKAVMDLSPPKQERLQGRYTRARSIGDEEDDTGAGDKNGDGGEGVGNTSQDSTDDLHIVGLGLARGGEGVRKVKSNWELGGPAPTTRRGAVDGIVLPYGSPPDLSEEELLEFNGLPGDYEAQCDDDELYGVGYDESSMGSTRSTASGGSGDDSVDSQDWKSALAMVRSSSEGASGDEVGEDGNGEVSLDDHNIGARVMAGAIDYDDEYEDSPTKPRAPAVPVGGGDWTLPLIAPNFARRRSPSPTPPPETPPATVKPVLKYGDRATKLRIAKSQPVLRAQPSTWFGSIKSAIGLPLLPTNYAPIPSAAVNEPPRSAPAPIKLSPIAPAAPALITSIPVICDSGSQEAVDLPALPSPPLPQDESSSTGVVGSIALRAKSSLAKLRIAVESAVGIPPVPPLPTNDDGSLVLSPRIDWSLNLDSSPWGSHAHAGSTISDSGFASFQTPGRPIHPAFADDEIGAGMEAATRNFSVDYTKSFFYKPPTPPHPTSASNDDPSAIDEATPPISTAEKEGLTKRKSIKSLRAALLIPVAPPPPVPTLPSTMRTPAKHRPSGSGNRTPPLLNSPSMRPPLLAILSPGAWERGLPPRELVLEGEEWDAREAYMGGDWGSIRRKKSGKKVKRKSSKKAVKA